MDRVPAIIDHLLQHLDYPRATTTRHPQASTSRTQIQNASQLRPLTTSDQLEQINKDGERLLKIHSRPAPSEDYKLKAVQALCHTFNRTPSSRIKTVLDSNKHFYAAAALQLDAEANMPDAQRPWQLMKPPRRFEQPLLPSNRVLKVEVSWIDQKLGALHSVIFASFRGTHVWAGS